MKKSFACGAAATLVAGGISIALAAPANAGCIYNPFWVGSERTCDGPVDENGWFTRCVTVIVIGFGGPNCYEVDIRNMSNQHYPFYIQD